jgi:hypothetical protein
MEIICAVFLLICSLSSLFFLFQILGGLFQALTKPVESKYTNYVPALIIAIISGLGFACSASAVYEQGHNQPTENIQPK